MTRYRTRILSTRPLSPSLAEDAAEKGILLESLSFIETCPMVDEHSGLKIKEYARIAIVAVFTSMNAVDAVAQCLAGRPEAARQTGANAGANELREDQRDGRIALPWKIFCIGSATRERVEENFGEGCISGIADSAAALAAEIIGQGGIKEVIFFCGDQRRDELPEKLREEGIPVQEFVVYKTLPTPHPLNEVYDGVVFFSPSAVNSFFSVNTLPAATLLFAIGRTTAEAIREWSGNPVIISDSPGKAALIRQMIDHF